MIIGGGGHGLATAYYLAARHGVRNVAVVERAYIGSGNVGRNTTLVRSNYLMDGNTQFFEYSLQLWEGLSHELNFNVMLSQRGQIVLAHGPSQLDVLARKGNIMRLNGIDAELLDRGDVMLRVHPEVVKALKSTTSRWLQEMEEMVGKTILVKSDPTLHPEQFDIH